MPIARCIFYLPDTDVREINATASNNDEPTVFDEEASLLLQPDNFMSLKSMDVDFSKLDASLNDSVEELLAGLNKGNYCCFVFNESSQCNIAVG